MFSKKIVWGVGGTVAVLATAIGAAGIASAETPSPTPTPTASQAWQGGGGHGRAANQAANPNAGQRNGAGYGAAENAQYLSEQLGVSQDAVTAALQKYHVDNPAQTRGRDLTDAQQASEHAKLAAFLASELKVDEAKVLDALNARQDVRRADRTARLTENLDAAVKAGTLTQAQADAVVAAHQAGAMGGGRGAGFGGGPRR